MEPEVVGVQLPWMRAEVIGAVDAFADPDYQRRVWVDRVMPSASYSDDLSTNVHILYDSPGILPDPGSSVGSVLLGEDEVRALADFDREFGPLLRELGDAPDAAYLAHPAWSGVVATARTAAAVLHAHGGAFPGGTG